MKTADLTEESLHLMLLKIPIPSDEDRREAMELFCRNLGDIIRSNSYYKISKRIILLSKRSYNQRKRRKNK